MATVCIASSWAVLNTRIAISYKHGQRELQKVATTYTTVRDEQLGKWPMVTSTLAAHRLDGVDRGAGDAGDAAEHRLWCMETRHDGPLVVVGQ